MKTKSKIQEVKVKMTNKNSHIKVSTFHFKQKTLGATFSKLGILAVICGRSKGKREHLKA